MRFVIEGYPYPRAAIKQVVPEFLDLSLQNDNAEIRLGYVGYCYSPDINDSIFFLPKVILEESNDSLVFGKYSPIDLLNAEDAYRKKRISADDFKFLHDLSTWLYRAIKEFKDHHKDSKIVTQRSASFLDSSHHKVDATIMDVILSLIKYYKENQNFFMFVIRNIHSGYNKLNWRKTIGLQQPYMQNGKPIYLKPINKKKQINFDEELLIIFYSILNYINKEQGFPCKVNCNYELIDGSLFKAYRKGLGKTRLKEIKYKYYSDKALRLWELCYAYFDCSSQILSSKKIEDLLIASDFNVVFEGIIDELIGENAPEDLHYKEQYDGKRVDHIYPYTSLIRPDNIYYIGDSKYYKIGGSLGTTSVYKQYTYAKNVIQYNFNPFDGKIIQKLPYRDELTEGYNITPNFFISAELHKKPYLFDKPMLVMRETDKDKRVSKQFDNRLFDRDTLWLSHYDINFLYVLALYGRGNYDAKHTFKKKVGRMFRNQIIELIKQQYFFYKVLFESQEELVEFVNKNFKTLIGKIYHYDENLYIILALEQNNKEDHDRIKNMILSQNYNLVDFEFE